MAQEKQNGAEMVEKIHPTASDDAPPVSVFATWTRAQCVKKFWRLYSNGLGVSVAGLYAGYANSVIGSIVANQGFIEQYGTVKDPQTGKLALNATHISLWGALYFVTAICIQAIAPITADRFGRKFNMWGITFFITLSILVQCFSKTWWEILIARLIAGCAGGLMGTSCMVYMSEIALPQFRGALLAAFSMAFALGQVFLAVGLKVLEETEPLAFRHMFYSEFVFTGLWLIPLLWVPESPVWYCSKGRHEDAKKGLRRLVGDVEGYDIDHEYSVLQYETRKSKELAEAAGTSDWKALRSKVNLVRCIIATLPFTFQNVCGVPLMFGYTVYFFQLAGVKDPFLGNLIKQLVLVLGILTSFYTVDKVGRRALVLYGGASMCIINTIVGGLGFIKQNNASGIALVFLCSLWAFVYANSLAPIGWISLVETSSPRLRAKTTSIAVTIQYLTGILFNYTVPLMLSNQNAGWALNQILDSLISMDSTSELSNQWGQANNSQDTSAWKGSLAFFIETIESMGVILAHLHERVAYDKRDDVARWLNKFRTLDQQLIRWKLQLPLQWADSGVSRYVLPGVMDPVMTEANALHNTNVILLHECIAYPQTELCFVPLPSSQSAATCYNAALEVFSTVRKFLQQRKEDYVLGPYFGLCIFISARNLLMHSQRNILPLATEFSQSIETLENLAHRARGANVQAFGSVDLFSRFAGRLRTLHARVQYSPDYRIDIREPLFRLTEQDSEPSRERSWLTRENLADLLEQSRKDIQIGELRGLQKPAEGVDGAQDTLGAGNGSIENLSSWNTPKEGHIQDEPFSQDNLFAASQALADPDFSNLDRILNFDDILSSGACMELMG
ncbi:hypothetical protein E8E13_003257 [Curvularia kusanoi]|uniref:Major facilitator superfamily (MFS) profile domain-containing protein n=1 Tax=Curvularia kusanoi TaxID=90978 RepID=A0A9P4T650_CURKU|nr:hypothetical protein E8E13_003257 [Curvularia kusanoi]